MVVPGWTRLWLSLTVLSAPPLLAAATFGNWSADTSRIIVATALMSLAALSFFLLSLLLRLHLALLGWIIAGFDFPTRRAIRRHLWPLLRAVLMILALGSCLFWLRSAPVSHEPPTSHGSFCPTTTTSI